MNNRGADQTAKIHRLFCACDVAMQQVGFLDKVCILHHIHVLIKSHEARSDAIIWRERIAMEATRLQDVIMQQLGFHATRPVHYFICM